MKIKSLNPRFVVEKAVELYHADNGSKVRLGVYAAEVFKYFGIEPPHNIEKQYHQEWLFCELLDQWKRAL